MSEGAELYERDFVAWTEEQSARIRAAAAAKWNLPIDWLNVAEEIEDLGKSDRRELGSRLETIIEHLLKLKYSPARDPRRGWTDTVARERNRVEGLLEQSPSLRSDLDRLLPQAHRRAAKLVRLASQEYGEAVPEWVQSPASGELTISEVLGDWFPQEP